MGVAVSSWSLARAVAKQGQLGVVSGTGLDTVLARRLQLGDEGGHMREALAHFPMREMADKIVERYFIEGGRAPKAPFKSKPLPSIAPSASALELVVAANFVEVWLAKQGHDGVVGINLLEKIQLPTLPALFGAMLAGVDYVLMGAGIPRNIPVALDHLAALEPTDLPITVAGAPSGKEYFSHFNPKTFCPDSITSLKRPAFLAIISSAVLALTLARKCASTVEGFVVEGPTAGGHNAPPRGELTLDEHGEPIYGPRDKPDLEQIRGLGLPFWLAGSCGSADGLQHALDQGATGIQVGTAFAFCEESGIDPALKARVLELSKQHQVELFTDPKASPTGFPFKVVQLDGTVSNEQVYEERERVCDLGYLRETYLTPEGKIGYRCPGEPVGDYLKKGGALEQTVGRKCVCNGLMSTVGLVQMRKDGSAEPPVVTAGDDVKIVAEFLKPGQDTYAAKDVIATLLAGVTSSAR